MTGLTAADYADTGQWRLLVRIYMNGMSAHLENTIHTELEPQQLFAATWDPGEGTLLQNVENAVYDHPRVLDDFSARIVVYDPKTVFIPTRLAEETEGAEETYYTAIYEADPADVMTDTDADITVAYSPSPGIKGFLNRTFPGARIGCHLMELVKQLRKRTVGHTLYVEARGEETDFVLLDGEKLLSASTHPVIAESDIVYHALNIIDVYGLSPKETEIQFLGTPPSDGLAEVIKQFTKD